VIIVSDTLPITNLIAINEIGLLRELFGLVHVPPAVHQELPFLG